MKSLFIIFLIICFFGINSVRNECHEYRPSQDIKERIEKETGIFHFGCCGLNKILPTSQNKAFVPFGNTKAWKELLEEMSEVAKEKAGFTLDFQCSSQNDEIKGICDEFYGITISNASDCFKLTTPVEKDTTFCGLKGKNVYAQNDVNIGLTSCGCMPYPYNENERDEYIKNVLSKWKIILESYIGGNENDFNKLLLIAFIYLDSLKALNNF